MKQLVILPGQLFAGYCSTGGHNKDWAACLAVELEESEPLLTPLSDTRQVVFVSLHGPHGGTMVVDTPKKLPLRLARGHFQSKMNEKRGKGYAQIAFAPFVQAFGCPLGLPLMFREKPVVEAQSQSVTQPPEEPETLPITYRAVTVKPIALEKLNACIKSGYGQFALSEKVNGERCIIWYDGQNIVAFNRRGIKMSAPPEGAEHLKKLEKPFVIDGERLTEGRYVAFDVLMIDGEDQLDVSYAERIMRLRNEMLKAKLLYEPGMTPTFGRALRNSAFAQLALLIAVTGIESCTRVMNEVEDAVGEGVILRDLTAPYSSAPQKYKYLAALDGVVVEINEGVSEGSLKIGVYRTSDRALIEIANVRSGLNDGAIREVREMLARGERPVFTLSYLPARTVSLQLVEPRTSMACYRTDKLAVECTTDQFIEQFGKEKLPLIEAAAPYRKK